MIRFQDYRFEEQKNGLFVRQIENFDLEHTFTCGQCFRWQQEKDGSFSGVAFGKYINVMRSGKGFLFRNTSLEEFEKIWFTYFDLATDYSAIKEDLCRDRIMKEAASFGWGIRVLRQELWEVLLSFIISSNNIIPRIMKIVNSLSEHFGGRIEHEGLSHYAFPTPEQLVRAEPGSLEACRAGYRCRYIREAACMVAGGVMDLDGLKGQPTGSIRNELLKIPGVGPKVADCIILYSGLDRSVFPTDVWIKRVVEALYFGRTASIKEVHDFARKSFGEWSGIAQQYLFYYARENRIGK